MLRSSVRLSPDAGGAHLVAAPVVAVRGMPRCRRGRVSVLLPSSGGFNHLLLAGKAICRCPSRATARSTVGNPANVGLTGSYQTEGAHGRLPWVCRKHIGSVHVLCKNNAAVTLHCAGQQFGVHQLRRLAASLPCPDASRSSPAAEHLALSRDTAAEQAHAENGRQRSHFYRALAVRDADDRPPKRGHHPQRRSL